MSVQQRHSDTPAPASSGIQSLEVGAALLRALLAAEAPMSLSRLAAAAGMTRTKAHKYLASFTRIGLVARNRDGLGYELGPMSLELGYAAMRQADMISLSERAIRDLRDQLGATASVGVWANKGVTVVRWAEAPSISSAAIRLGMVLPVLTTATGLVFAAFADPALTRAVIERELAEPSADLVDCGIRSWADVERRVAGVRAQGFATQTGMSDASTTRISAPIFDVHERMVAALVLVGPAHRFDVAAAGKPVQALLEAAREVSRRLGSRWEFAEAGATAVPAAAV